MVRRVMVIAVALAMTGLVCLLGGYAMSRSGDVVYVFPFWVQTIGVMTLAAGIYLYTINRRTS